MLLLCFILTKCVLGLNNERLLVPKFNSAVTASNKTVLYNFTCTMYKLPVGGILQFYLNQRSIDTLRFSNKMCHNKHSKCTSDICSCSYTDYSFTWWHIASASNVLKTFEVDMKFKTNRLGKFKCVLARTYNNTVIMDTYSYLQSMEFPEAVKPETVNNQHAVILATFMSVFMMFILVVVCWVRKKINGYTER
ncbi:unnamed protein product [Mytilus coruscus]|uniref:Uncharacterized protein n=1 Tax=Mytilus coruscus TaxID=42192 RepID=A0A6J8CAM1_MYTCO|nr:unnamed protein product [Mytilus coruscus]